MNIILDLKKLILVLFLGGVHSAWALPVQDVDFLSDDYNDNAYDDYDDDKQDHGHNHNEDDHNTDNTT